MLIDKLRKFKNKNEVIMIHYKASVGRNHSISGMVGVKSVKYVANKFSPANECLCICSEEDIV